MIEIKELNKDLIHTANSNSFNGKRGYLSLSNYQGYAKEILNWNVSDEKKEKLLNQLYNKWSELLKLEASHVSVMVAGPSKYNAKKLDKGDRILETSSEVYSWFKELKEQLQESKKDDKVQRLLDRIEFYDNTKELDPTARLAELAMLDNQKFIELFEKLQDKYKWRKNSTVYKLYLKSKVGEIQEIKKDIIFENADYTAYTEGDRAYIKFTLKPQRQLIVALKSRKWWWNARQNAWSTYLDKLNKEWVSNLSNQYAKYI